MAKPGAVPRSVILLVVLLVQYCPQTLKSVSAARYAPAVVSPEETGRTWGASLVPRDVGAAGSKLERRLSDDREESTHGAAHEDTGNEVKTNRRPLCPHGHHHHRCSGYERDDQSRSGTSIGKGKGGSGCGRQGGEGGGLGSRSRDGGYSGDNWDGRNGRDGGWAMDTCTKRSQKKSISKDNGGIGNGNGNGLGGECGPSGLGDGRGPGGRQLGEDRGGPGDGRAPGGGQPGGGKPSGR